MAAHGVPAAVVGLLLLLPFLDRSPERRPWKRPVATAVALLLVGGVVTLTLLGLGDVPPPDPETRIWGAQALGGRAVASQDACTRCHRAGGAASEWAHLRPRRDEAWVRGHAYAPDLLVPDVPPGLDAIQMQPLRAVAAWAKAVRRGTPPPALPETEARALAIVGANCLGCHVLDGDGQGKAPNLSRAGRKRTATWLAGSIADPTAYEYDTDMPAFGNRLSEEQIGSVARYLATRK